MDLRTTACASTSVKQASMPDSVLRSASPEIKSEQMNENPDTMILSEPAITIASNVVDALGNELDIIKQPVWATGKIHTTTMIFLSKDGRTQIEARIIHSPSPLQKDTLAATPPDEELNRAISTLSEKAAARVMSIIKKKNKVNVMASSRKKVMKPKSNLKHENPKKAKNGVRVREIALNEEKGSCGEDVESISYNDNEMDHNGIFRTSSDSNSSEQADHLQNKKECDISLGESSAGITNTDEDTTDLNDVTISSRFPSSQRDCPELDIIR